MRKCKFCNEDIVDEKRRLFCSKKCKCRFHDGVKKPKIKETECKKCGKTFKPYTSLNKFCSSNCRIENEKSRRLYRHSKEACENRSGKNNPAYRNGMYTRKTKKSAEGLREFRKVAKEISEQIILDFGFIKCQHCNRSDSVKFETHHIVFRSEKPKHKNLHKKENLILLCIQCHNDFHKYKPKRNDIVRERKLNELFGDDVLDKVGSNDT